MADDEINTIQTLNSYLKIMPTCLEERGSRVIGKEPER
jgi:hypothetical protein